VIRKGPSGMTQIRCIVLKVNSAEFCWDSNNSIFTKQLCHMNKYKEMIIFLAHIEKLLIFNQSFIFYIALESEITSDN
jgi:hypothetical protein